MKPEQPARCCSRTLPDQSPGVSAYGPPRCAFGLHDSVCCFGERRSRRRWRLTSKPLFLRRSLSVNWTTDMEAWTRAWQAIFETRDLYLACFLRCAGYELLDSEGRCKMFVFQDRLTR